MSSVTGVQAYQYSKLKPGQIRLIELQPHPDINAPVYCNLRHAYLESFENDPVQNYIALSYVWGNPTTSREVLIEGGTCHTKVTASLGTALRNLRHDTQSYLLWADALCINQEDVEERNQQVSIMGRIYAAARSTIIFLCTSSSLLIRGSLVIRNGE